MSDELVTSARRWRERAEAMRSLAKVMTGRDMRASMRWLTGDYDGLADRAEAHARPRPLTSPPEGQGGT
jgi:hypothetical protein